MMAVHLKKTVVAGGVVYPAGTSATPELRELIADQHWAGEASYDSSGFEQAIAERDATISGLEAQVAELRAEVEQLSDDGSSKKGYAGRSVDELQAEADKRGLEVEGTGKDGNVLKADLVSALEADDEG